MKTKLNLGNLKVKEIGLDISNVTVEAEYDMKEMFQLVDLMKYMTASMPEILENLANAYLTFEDASEHIANVMNEESEDDYMEGCCPVRLPNKEDMIGHLLGSIAGEIKRREAEKEANLESAMKEVADEDAKKEEMEEALAEIKEELKAKGLPEFLQEAIIESLKEDIKAGRAILKKNR